MSRSCIKLVGNTTSVQNLGDGANIFKDKIGGNLLQFKSIYASGATLVFEEEDRLVIWSSGGGTEVYNFKNGITQEIDDVKLGGNLTENTRISGGTTYSLTLDTTSTYMCNLPEKTSETCAIYINAAGKLSTGEAGAGATNYWTSGTTGLIPSNNEQVRVSNKLITTNLQVTGGTLNSGYVLTSDGSGNAIWQAGGGGGTTYWTSGATGLIPSNGEAIDTSESYKIDGDIVLKTCMNNIAVGKNVLCSNTSGYGNIGVGRCALTGNTSGIHNIASGFLSLANNTSGDYNVAIGRCAMYSNSVGDDNVAVGNLAGRSVTGSSSVFLGNEAGYFEFDSNRLHIANCTNCTLIYGEFDNKTVCIDNKLITTNLQVTDAPTEGYVLTSDFDGNATWQPVGGDVIYWTSGSTGLIPSNGEAIDTNASYKIGGDVILSVPPFSNLAVGKNVLNFNTNGYNNTAVGFSTLSANTTGYNNVAVGYRALLKNTIGDSNVAIGLDSLCDNISGDHNVAVGFLSLKENVTGNYNTANGACALIRNISGCCNTAIGHRAVERNTTGCYNVGIGDGAIILNTIGNSNVAVGYQAGCCVTGSSSVFLGNNAGRSEDEGCKLHIANCSFCTLIYGEFDNKLVCINNTLNTTNLTAINLTTNDITSDDITTTNLTATNLQVTGGTLTSGYVLTSDGSGNATWQVGSEPSDISGYTCSADNSVVIGNGTYKYCAACVGRDSQVIIGENAHPNGGGSSRFNVVIGTEAMNSGISTACNVVIGYNALCSATSSGHVVAIGYGALEKSTAFFSTAVGSFSMNQNTTGSYNTALGYNTLGDVTTGESNVAVGLSSLSKNLTGSENVGIGRTSLGDLINGTNNTAIGTSSGNNLTGGTYNVFVGNFSGIDNVSGSCNVFIGHCTGRYYCGSCSVIIGPRAGYSSLNRDEDSILRIGNSDSYPNLIEGSFTNKCVKINNKLITCKLQVTSGVTDGYVLTADASGNATWQPAATGSGSVISVAASCGMSFGTITSSGSVCLGLPSTLTLTSNNSNAGTTHTHALSIANFTSTTAGLAPASGGGTTKFLRADGTWQVPSGVGTGTVTAVSAGCGMSFTTINDTGDVCLGLPSTLTLTSINSNAGLTHTHALNITNFTSSAAGLAPASGGGTVKYLRADGTWQEPPGEGVTSVSAGNGMSFTTITGTGNVTMGLPATLTLNTINWVGPTNHCHTLNIANFTSTTAGLAPQSGGGTTKYLRADGTWQVPPGSTGTTPGGSNTQVQYNNNGSFAGSANFTFDGTNVDVSGSVCAADFELGSDIRYKTNIVAYTPVQADIQYREFELCNCLGQKRYGVIAQEVEKIYPEVVRCNEDGYLSISYIDLLIREVAYLKDKVIDLQNCLNKK